METAKLADDYLQARREARTPARKEVTGLEDVVTVVGR